MTDDNAEYGLVMKFLDGSESFCHGYECGLVDGEMRASKLLEMRTVHTANKQQIEMIANVNNYSVEWQESSSPEWIYLTANPNGGAKEKRKGFTVVDGGLA